jgi:copper chaperone CopZ
MITDPLQRKILQAVYDKHRETPELHMDKGFLVYSLLEDVEDEDEVADVRFAVDYLIDTRCLKKVPGSRKEEYRLSEKGLAEIDAEKYPRPKAPVLTINADHSIIVNGANYGTISQTNHEAIETIEKLIGAIQASDLPDSQKLDAITDADTLRVQLTRSRPNPDIIRIVWDNLGKLATLAGVSDFIMKLAPIVEKLI